MAKDKIEESQQQSQDVALGTQANQDITIPQGTKGSHHKKEEQDDRHIPNQENSSASNREKSDGSHSH